MPPAALVGRPPDIGDAKPCVGRPPPPIPLGAEGNCMLPPDGLLIGDAGTLGALRGSGGGTLGGGGAAIPADRASPGTDESPSVPGMFEPGTCSPGESPFAPSVP